MYKKNLKNFELYRITLNRDSLNEFLTSMSTLGKIDIGVSKEGEVTFNIPIKSDISISSINIMDMLTKEVIRISQTADECEDEIELSEMEDELAAVQTTIELLSRLLDTYEGDDEDVQTDQGKKGKNS
jgi:hypothetical protein